MKAKNIAHLVGRMDAILVMIEHSIRRINMEDYQRGYLMDQLHEAIDVNNEIFDIHLKEVRQNQKNL